MASSSSAYLLGSAFSHRGHCQCGWQGKRRRLRGNAVLDVLDHCVDTGHVPVSIPPITLGTSQQACPIAPDLDV